ncbi:MAG: alanine racemase [Balneolaceae bacterium]|nr:alanine racemase [Balneolaceae bacterium]
MIAPTYIELDREKFQENVSFLKDYIGREAAFCSVIKGNAYGHGIKEFVPMAEDCGIDYFGVFSDHEAQAALEARKSEETEIMIMGMVSSDNMPWAIRNGISFFVFEPDRLRDALDTARELSLKARIHLHLETGMNRLGLDRDRLEEVVRLVRGNEDKLSLEGLCTHYAGAESVSNHVRVTRQIQRFEERCRELKQEGLKPRYRHSACSAAALNYPETVHDLVRIGIAQYGFWPNRETYMNFVKKHTGIDKKHRDPLQRVLSWKSQVMSTKSVDAGEFVGYGNTYLTSRDQKIATVPVGYSHGYGRNLTNTGRVLIRGQRAQVAGLVNMNMLTVDVTDIEGVRKGDEVVIIGRQGENEMTVASFSEMTNYMNYEVLTRLPSSIPRTVV